MKPNPPRRHFSTSNTPRSNRPYQQQAGRGGDNMMDSTGPAGKVRGTPQQVLDKYMTLGRDALSSGDYVMSESFFQYAEHYRRIIVSKRDERVERENNASTRERRHSSEAEQEGVSVQSDSLLDDSSPSDALQLPENEEKIERRGSVDREDEETQLPAFLAPPPKVRRPRVSAPREAPSSTGEGVVSKPVVRRRSVRPKAKSSETSLLEE